MNANKRSKHKDIVDDYKKTKSKHLEKLATKMLKNDEKFEKLKDYNINLDIFDDDYNSKKPE
jgi:hypothetical protein